MSFIQKIIYTSLFGGVAGVFREKTVGTVALSNNDETEHEMKILQNITKQLYWNSTCL